MNLTIIPLFLKNPEWYIFDEEKWRYFLTKKGAQNDDVKKSFDEFYADSIVIIKRGDQDGNR